MPPALDEPSGGELGRDHFTRVRLEHVIVGTGGKRARDVLGVVLGRAIEYVGLAAVVRAPELAYDIAARRLRQRAVDQNGVWHALAQTKIDRLLPAFGFARQKLQVLDDAS